MRSAVRTFVYDRQGTEGGEGPHFLLVAAAVDIVLSAFSVFVLCLVAHSECPRRATLGVVARGVWTGLSAAALGEDCTESNESPRLALPARVRAPRSLWGPLAVKTLAVLPGDASVLLARPLPFADAFED